ncbi:hypothetical protein [cf. Phormidesmis sp. LEGE 11477]|uniref:hypothetical protein n=1 Tax=cf. Phormidesmis sp. LEGE 11477 TaxID=1828680 RepID=UPI0018828EB4|nr:hypothetical protein [cf. Phormidesmis sp. LEGE 11477]MBE9064702.1 hypothetical protein [cf. Phormidesmis sp. LEGE 11477]
MATSKQDRKPGVYLFTDVSSGLFLIPLTFKDIEDVVKLVWGKIVLVQDAQY